MPATQDQIAQLLDDSSIDITGTQHTLQNFFCYALWSPPNTVQCNVKLCLFYSSYQHSQCTVCFVALWSGVVSTVHFDVALSLLPFTCKAMQGRRVCVYICGSGAGMERGKGVLTMQHVQTCTVAFAVSHRFKSVSRS